MKLYDTKDVATEIGCDRSTVTKSAAKLGVGKRFRYSYVFTKDDVDALRASISMVTETRKAQAAHARKFIGKNTTTTTPTDFTPVVTELRAIRDLLARGFDTRTTTAGTFTTPTGTFVTPTANGTTANTNGATAHG